VKVGLPDCHKMGGLCSMKGIQFVLDDSGKKRAVGAKKGAGTFFSILRGVIGDGYS
jgi:hypothetical protein